MLSHAVLTASTAAALCLVYFLTKSPSEHYRWSLATGYTGLVLLCATLFIGPMNTLRGRSTPISTDLRRDFGIWAGVVSIWHTILGLQSHMGGETWKYFFYHDQFGPLSDLRHDLFGWANHTGLLAAILALMLTMLSNDLSIRTLGGGRWKLLQQSNYVLFGLAVLHSLLYQMLGKQAPPYVFALGCIAASAACMQAARMLLRRANVSTCRQ